MALFVCSRSTLSRVRGQDERLRPARRRRTATETSPAMTCSAHSPSARPSLTTTSTSTSTSTSPHPVVSRPPSSLTIDHERPASPSVGTCALAPRPLTTADRRTLVRHTTPLRSVSIVTLVENGRALLTRDPLSALPEPVTQLCAPMTLSEFLTALTGVGHCPHIGNPQRRPRFLPSAALRGADLIPHPSSV